MKWTVWYMPTGMPKRKKVPLFFARKKRLDKNPAMELMITVMLHKTDDSEWTKEELSPIKEMEMMDVTPVFSTLGVKITLADDNIYEVYFEEIDGNRRW